MLEKINKKWKHQPWWGEGRCWASVEPVLVAVGAKKLNMAGCSGKENMKEKKEV